MPKKQQWVWPIGPKNESTLSAELRPAFGNDAIFIDRRGGSLVVITVDEAEHLAQILPLIIAKVREREQQQPAA